MDHLAIIAILQQLPITSTTSTMKLNLRLVRAFQFLQQFKLNVWYKPSKEHIVLDALSRLASTNRHPNPQHSELDVLFIYNTTLFEMHLALVSQILAGYKANPWWAWLQLQIQANNNLEADAPTLLFLVDSTPPTDSDFYLAPRPNGDENLPLSSMDIGEIPERFPAPNKSRLLYHINKLTNVHCLCILLSVVSDILAVAHGESHLGFSSCYKIIIRSWYICGLTKLFRAFIRHCSQCLALQTRQHTPYGSLQTIESPPFRFLC